MRCIESGGSVVVAIVASRAPGRWAWVLRPQLYSIRSVRPKTMKKHIALFVASLTAVTSVVAASYSTEATMTPQKDKSVYEVIVRVSHLVEKDGKVTEELIARPKVSGPLGVPASMYSGLQPTQADYQKEDNVTVDVSWPKAGQSGVAFCTVTVKRGDRVVSKSKLQVTVEDK
jgi:hypothetical protein